MDMEWNHDAELSKKSFKKFKMSLSIIFVKYFLALDNFFQLKRQNYIIKITKIMKLNYFKKV